MKCERIYAENFLSYQKMDLPMSGLGRIFTVTGSNGSGKTTLVKSLAALLYEQTPSDGKGISRFVRNVSSWGNPEAVEALRKKKQLPVLKMEGIFTQGGARYRVVRSFDPNLKQSGHMLSIQRKPVQNPVDGWEVDDATNITGQTISDTQADIEQLFGNYRSFITSTFMSSGVSGFLDAADEDREEVAAFIFGCEGYDKRLQAASDKRLALERSIEADQIRLTELKAKAGTLDAVIAELHGHRDASARAAEEVATVEASLTKINTEKEAQQKKITQAEEAACAVREIQARISNLQVKAQGWKDLLAQSENIRAGAEKLRAAREVIREQQELYTKAHEIEAQIQKLGVKIDAEKQQLAAEHKQDVIEFTRARTAASDLERGEKKIQEILKSLGELRNVAADMEATQGKINECITREADLKAKADALNVDIAKDKKSAEFLNTAEAHCDRCRQMLTPEIKAGIISELNDKINENTTAVTAYREEYAESMKERNLHDAGLRSLQAEARRLQELNQQLAREEATLKQVRELAGKSDELGKAVSALALKLENDDFCLNEREQVEHLREDWANIGFNQEAYTAALNAERDNAKHESMAAKLENAAAEIDTLNKELVSENGALSLKSTQSALLEPLLEDLAAIQDAANELGAAMAELRSKQQNIEIARKDAERRHTDALDAEKQAVAIESGSKDALKGVAILRVLESAYKSAGIPKMMYDRYLPALTNKVNYVLSILNPGWEVRIISKLNTRGKFTIPVDTIDPKGITLQYGQRSTGERFILALSFLVGMALFWGERTGAQPQHILIDEGFGSLDPQNLEKAKAAISAAAINFGQVGIISHLPELVSLGQVQLNVYNDKETGSNFEIAGTASARPARISKTYLFDPDQLAAISAGTSVIQDAIPGMKAETVLEMSVAEKAQSVGGRKPTKGKLK